MPRYLLFRTADEDMSWEDLEAAAHRSMEVAEQLGVRWIRSYWDVEEGKFYCEYEAPSVELLFEHARRARVPLDHAVVVRELEPSMFR